MKAFRNSILAIFIALTFFSCEKDEEQVNKVDFGAIVGTYQGTITNENSSETNPAQADISKANEEAIYVHCFSDEMDTTFMLNIFENGDFVMVCMTGQDFQNEYGHIYENNHMMHSSMGAGWEHHIADQHNGPDTHYGSFEIMNQSFTYTFNIANSDSTYSLTFNGNRM